MRLTVFSPSGAVEDGLALQRALERLRGLGFDARRDRAAMARQQRFAGSDDARLAAIHRVADEAPSVAMATRGGYGLTRLLDSIAWKKLARSVQRGTRWVGLSDFTALQLGLLAHTGAGSWAGPCALEGFGRTDAAGGVDDVTAACFAEAMRGELEAVGFRTDAGLDGLAVRGTLWGSNLAMLCSLLGTPHMPKVRGGVLFVEDVNEHPYRIERMLLQLLQAGVLAAQKAVVLGAFDAWAPSPNDRGYGLKTVVAHLRSRLKVPVLTGLPFGHVPTKVTLPVGARVTLAVQGRQAFIGWGHG
ncbi:MAG: LD-carboxypeptidase [Rubrivivax sp.]|nr:LD-carboxypeptidase [Rubrivivax sp.]